MWQRSQRGRRAGVAKDPVHLLLDRVEERVKTAVAERVVGQDYLPSSSRRIETAAAPLEERPAFDRFSVEIGFNGRNSRAKGF